MKIENRVGPRMEPLRTPEEGKPRDLFQPIPTCMHDDSLGPFYSATEGPGCLLHSGVSMLMDDSDVLLAMGH